MLNTWQTVKGYMMAGIALVACPCHLPITLPILISATAGTAIGVWLENNAIVVTGVATVIFLGGSLLAFKWLMMSPASISTTGESARLNERSP